MSEIIDSNRMPTIKQMTLVLAMVLSASLLSACNCDGDCDIPPTSTADTDTAPVTPDPAEPDPVDPDPVDPDPAEPDEPATTAECTTRFCKIGSDGERLDPDASEWSCVEDTLLGKFWEVKTDDGGLRDKDWSYAATGDAGACGDSLGDGVACTTDAYVAAVNASDPRPCGPTRTCSLPPHADLMFLAFPDEFFPTSGQFTTETRSYEPDTAFFPNYIPGGLYFNATDGRQVNYEAVIDAGSSVDAISLLGMAPPATPETAGLVRLSCE